jgi:hypothetical protein
MIECRLYSREEFREREDGRREAHEKWRKENVAPEPGQPWTEEQRAIDRLYIPAGSMWFCHWYHDPEKPEDLEKVDRRIADLLAEPNAPHHLSIHYWQSWARIRPPICVVCPDFRHWVVDSKSTNGTGWTVMGEAPKLVCSPSIWTSMSNPASYHGYLGQNGAPPGWFSNPV